jgi:hypothetical protein
VVNVQILTGLSEYPGIGVQSLGSVISPKYMHLDEPYDVVESRVREPYESGIHIFLILGDTRRSRWRPQ